MGDPVPVLTYNQYVGGSESPMVYSKRHFCGACSRGIGGVYGSACYGFPEYPEDLETKNNSTACWMPAKQKEPLEYYAYCPWCGVSFANEWWRDRTIQNERVIDHYQSPGTHKGDTHEFRGSGPECMAGHWLAVSGGSEVCWCEPEIEPGIMGCVIRHQDKRYEDVVALRQEMATEGDDDWEEDWDDDDG